RGYYNIAGVSRQQQRPVEKYIVARSSKYPVVIPFPSPLLQRVASQLDGWLDRFSQLSLLVVGDFFLDKYFVIDRALSEVWIETGERTGCSPVPPLHPLLMERGSGGEVPVPQHPTPREIERLDIKNRDPLAEELEAEVLERLRQMVSRVDGVIVADQVPERNC